MRLAPSVRWRLHPQSGRKVDQGQGRVEVRTPLASLRSDERLWFEVSASLRQKIQSRVKIEMKHMPWMCLATCLLGACTKGPAGEPGPAGPPGVAGPQGPAGPEGAQGP